MTRDNSGLWSVSVAEAPHDNDSFSIYIKSPTHNLTLTRTASEIIELDMKIRSSGARVAIPPLPLSMKSTASMTAKAGKRRSTFLNALTKLSKKRSGSFAASPMPTPSPTCEKADPFLAFVPPYHPSPRPHSQHNASATDIASYLTSLAKVPSLRNTRAFKRFIHVGTDDLESTRTERPLKRMRPNVLARMGMGVRRASPVEDITTDLNLSAAVQDQQPVVHRVYRSYSAAARIHRTSTTGITVPPRSRESEESEGGERQNGSAEAIEASSADESGESEYRVPPRKAIGIEDFELMRVLGKGCAGKVLLVRQKDGSERLYALKAIMKRHVLAHQELMHTLTEQAILKRLSSADEDGDGTKSASKHPFLVKLWWSFHDKDHLFLVLDFHPGGDLATQLSRWGRLGRDRARFYAAEIVEGLEALHAEGVIYRDLKPENVLIGRDGHIVLTDFGLAKEFPKRMRVSSSAGTMTAPFTPAAIRGVGTRLATESWDGASDFPWQSDGYGPRERDLTSTFCGTAEYLAPEVIQGMPYSYSVDWWALGTLLFEMLVGITPFWGATQHEMYTRVLQDDLCFPESKSIDAETQILLRGLLQKDPLLRLSEPLVKRQAYFGMIDWSHVHHKRYIPPHIPPTDPVNADDTQNFDHMFLDMDPVLDRANMNVQEDGATSDLTKDVDLFNGYSYGAGTKQNAVLQSPSPYPDEGDSVESDEPYGDVETTASRPPLSHSTSHRLSSSSSAPTSNQTDEGGEENDWHLVEREHGEARNGNRARPLIAREVVDRYRLAFRKASLPTARTPPASPRDVLRKPKFLRMHSSSKAAMMTALPLSPPPSPSLSKLKLPASFTRNKGTAFGSRMIRTSAGPEPPSPISPLFSLGGSLCDDSLPEGDEPSAEAQEGSDYSASELQIPSTYSTMRTSHSS